MKFISLAHLFALLLCWRIHLIDAHAALRDVFNVKGGITNGGCDDLKDIDLEAMYNDVVEKIEFASKAFEEYSSDFQIRKLAKAFFDVQMNDQGTEVKDEANGKKLVSLKEGYQAMRDVIDGKKNALAYKDNPFKKSWLYCNSDWVEKVGIRDDYLSYNEEGKLSKSVYKTVEETVELNNGQETKIDVQKMVFAGPEDKVFVDVYQAMDQKQEEARGLMRGTLAPYFARDLGQYKFDDADEEKSVRHCSLSGARGFTTVLQTGSFIKHPALATTLCLRTGRINKPKSLDTSKGVGTYLRDLEMESLTFLHEIFHVSELFGASNDLSAWDPPEDIPIRLEDGNVNPNWPGDPQMFHLKRKEGTPGKPNYGQADSPTAILLLSLVNGRLDENQKPVDVTRNPQNYAWAAMAVYLARNGAKLDYSTGKARVLNAAPGRVHPSESPGKLKRDFAE